MEEELLYNMAITELSGVGNVTAKKLIAYCGSAKQVFHEKQRILEKVPGVGTLYAKSIAENKKNALHLAEIELRYIEKNEIRALFYLDSDYPKRLTHCDDGPVILYVKGAVDLNKSKVVSIVGARKATDYGKEFCKKIIEQLIPHDPIIVSGLAYGVDVHSHKLALEKGLSTVGVLAHGLDKLYPSQHKFVADQMLEKGGLVSDYKSGTNPDRENFPKRNRIVAGLSDLTIVVESGKRGGSLITANLANDYNREVFALPGRLSDLQSEGCNNLIKSHQASLIQSVKDIEYIMTWKTKKETQPKQQTSLVELKKEEKIIFQLLKEKGKLSIDDLSLKAKLPVARMSSLLLDMEFSGVVRTFPGKMYQLR